MVKETELHKKIAAEKTHLQKQEDHKKMLYDRTIGGENVPRPSPDFIKQHVGPVKSDAQIQKEAEENAKKQINQDRQEAERKRQVEESIHQHNERIAQQQQAQQQEAQRQAEQQRYADMFRQAASRSRDKGHEME